MTFDSLPEAEGENRDFMADETNVILGYYKNDEHLEWIMNTYLYNTRAGIRGGSIHITKEMASAKYILLHNHKDKAYLCKLNKAGAMVYGYDEMKKLNYPYTEPVSDEDKKHTYLVFPINRKGVENELQQYSWDPSIIPQLRGKYGTIISTIKLSELIKYSRIK